MFQVHRKVHEEGINVWMARPADRMRLKDKLNDNVSKAIKSIQGLVYYQGQNGMARGHADPGDGGLVIDNSNHACHKLLDALDHAFLHGIRNVTNGYWAVVRQLTHKGLVKDIELLPNVTTDLGRGRAWLHAALNEGLLESYVRLLGEQDKVTKKHYAKDSFVLDGDRMNVLMTLTSGLDCVTFQLDYDLPYLDLTPSPPRTREDYQEDDDGTSSHTSTSLHSSFSESRLDSPIAKGRRQSDSDSASVSSYDIHSQGGDVRDTKSPGLFPSDIDYPFKLPSSMQCHPSSQLDTVDEKGFRTFVSDPGRASNITPTDSTSVSSFGSTSEVDRHKRLENIVVMENEDEDAAGDTLEVFHITSKKGGGKGGKKKKKKEPGNSKNAEGARTLKSQQSTVSSRTEAMPRGNSKNAEGARTLKSQQSTVSSMTEAMPDSCDGISGIAESEILAGKFGESADQDEKRRCVLDGTGGRPKSTHVPTSGCDAPEPPMTSPTSCLPSNEAVWVNQDDFKTGHSFSLGDDIVKDNPAEVDRCDRALSPVEISALSEIEQRIVSMCSVDNNRHSSEGIKMTGESNSPRLLSGNGGGNKNFKGSSLNQSNDGTTQPSLSTDRLSSSDVDSEVGVQTHLETCPGQVNSTGEQDAEDDFDFYASSSHDDAGSSNNNNARTANQESLSTSKSNSLNKKKFDLANMRQDSQLEDYMDYILKSSDSPDNLSPREAANNSPDLFVSLDNNTKLSLMLDIFKQEDENFVKMFVCWENHTEGDPHVAFVLISDHYIYVLHYRRPSRKFALQSSTRLLDIIFVTTGLNEQTLNIERRTRDKSRQKQRLWLTPGHQALTLAMVDCLSETVKKAMDTVASSPSRFSVGSDVPLQKIGLRKHISKELHCEAQDVNINDYSLVYWEDSSSSSQAKDTVTKEGTLLLYTQDPLKGFMWKPVYLVLKNGMLCISNKKSDAKPHSIIGLGGDQCVGCRRTAVGSKQNCVELVLAQAGSRFLSATSAVEAADWSQALCLAVSEGVQAEGFLADCTACCSILSCGKIFMCHEDLNTRFLRTLGYAQVEDVTSISVDEKEKTYCILEFESTQAGVSSGQWVFYFASTPDCGRFISALEACWKEVFQVDLPVMPLDNRTLQHHCHTHVKHLRKMLTL